MEYNLNYNKFKDISDKNLLRKSALSRIILGTASTTIVCLFYSLAHAKYRNYSFSFVRNWFKGSLAFSFLFYTGNEILYMASNYFKIYTNFWINYTILAYNLSKVHYRHLIRNSMMKWYLAIKYSHKCFLYMLVSNLFLELILKLNREVYLYNESDIFDVIRERFKDKETNKPNMIMTYNDLEENFMKSFHVFNSEDKLKLVKKNAEYSWSSDSKWMKNMSLKTVDLYEMYKNNKI